jgi:ABC-type lipoprotein export system ATPase subunit
MMGRMRRINRVRGQTVIVVTHKTVFGQMANRVIRMSSGQVHACRSGDPRATRNWSR